MSSSRRYLSKEIAVVVQRQLNRCYRLIREGEFRLTTVFAQFAEGPECGKETYIPKMKFLVLIKQDGYDR